jgi:hypothetical protein
MRLRPVTVTLCVTFAAIPSWAAVPAPAEPFMPGCALPFASIATAHPIDNSCPIEGEGSAKSQLQNGAKNNFCASGVPVTLTYQNFKFLQTAAPQRCEEEHNRTGEHCDLRPITPEYSRLISFRYQQSHQRGDHEQQNLKQRRGLTDLQLNRGVDHLVPAKARQGAEIPHREVPIEYENQ